MDENPYESPETAAERPDRTRLGPGPYFMAALEFVAGAMAVMVVVALIGLVLSWSFGGPFSGDADGITDRLGSLMQLYWPLSCLAVVAVGILAARRSLNRSRKLLSKRAELRQELQAVIDAARESTRASGKRLNSASEPSSLSRGDGSAGTSPAARS